MSPDDIDDFYETYNDIIMNFVEKGITREMGIAIITKLLTRIAIIEDLSIEQLLEIVLSSYILEKNVKAA